MDVGCVSFHFQWKLNLSEGLAGEREDTRSYLHETEGQEGNIFMVEYL